jgi:3-deoxy-manno-octulosonate cytidylyltransferase (CMP-KDO synthetase)
MIEHVYRAVTACPLLDDVVIATCDREIADAASRFGAKAVMTSPAHERATDRTAEASSADDAEIVVMVQGDEPMVTAAMIETAVAPLVADPSLPCTNLGAAIRSSEELQDPNTIKVVTSKDGHALYFSRAAVPSPWRPAFEPGLWLKQVCVIGFRRRWLRRFAELPPGPLEVQESIDMLRFLEHGIPVRIVPTTTSTHAVDTPADLRLVASLMAAQRREP